MDGCCAYYRDGFGLRLPMAPPYCDGMTAGAPQHIPSCSAGCLQRRRTVGLDVAGRCLPLRHRCSTPYPSARHCTTRHHRAHAHNTAHHTRYFAPGGDNSLPRCRHSTHFRLAARRCIRRATSRRARLAGVRWRKRDGLFGTFVVLPTAYGGSLCRLAFSNLRGGLKHTGRRFCTCVVLERVCYACAVLLAGRFSDRAPFCGNARCGGSTYSFSARVLPCCGWKNV